MLQIQCESYDDVEKIVFLLRVPELDSKLEELRLSLREIYPDHSEEEINSVWSQLLQILDPFRVMRDNEVLRLNQFGTLQVLF